MDLLLGPFREIRALARVPRLWQVELHLQAAYLLRLPALFIFRERRALGCYRFEDESFFYGETPYDVACALVRRMGLGPKDVLYDLGCGRGKMVFTAHLLSGCIAVGVDLLPTYTAIARSIARRMGLTGVTILRADLRQVDLDDATAVYVNGWTFSDDLVASLREKIDVLPPGAWWASVGRAWEHPRLALEERVDFAFSWGRATVWLYRARALEEEVRSEGTANQRARGDDDDAQHLERPDPGSAAGGSGQRRLGTDPARAE